MHRYLRPGVLLIFATIPSLAWSDERPAAPKVKPLSSDSDVIKVLDGKTRKVTLYDLKPPITVTGTWDWNKKLISIQAGADHLEKKWDVKKGKYCVVGEPCRSLIVDGSKIYEINPNGKVHAVSE